MSEEKKEPKIHHGFRLPQSTLDTIRKAAEYKKISQADVIIMWAENWNTNAVIIKPALERTISTIKTAYPLETIPEPVSVADHGGQPPPPLPRLDKAVLVNEGSVHGLLHRAESHPVLRPSEEKGKK